MSAETATFKRILIVDDDDSLREVFQHVLRREGFEVEGASDGVQAQAKIQIKRPDLIIMDLMMPVMSGLEVVRLLQQEGFGDIPVIVVTGRYSVDSSYEQTVRQEPNVKDFVKKPFNYVQMAQRIRELLKA